MRMSPYARDIKLEPNEYSDIKWYKRETRAHYTMIDEHGVYAHMYIDHIFRNVSMCICKY